MQPGVVAGAAVELHAEKASSGTAPGTNVGSPTQFFDTSGNGNHGTLTTFAFTTSSGYAGAGTPADPYRLVFDGASDYLAVPDLSACEGGTFTYEVWMQKDAVSFGNLIAEYANQVRSGVSADRQMAELSTSSTTGKAAFVLRNSAAGQLNVVSPSSVCDGDPHHIVVSADGSNVRMWVDNVAVAGTYDLSYLPEFVDWTTIGARRYGSVPYVQSFYAGSLAVARIYPFGLSAADVAQNYAAGYRNGEPRVYQGFALAGVRRVKGVTDTTNRATQRKVRTCL